ncbi:hypothetical protein C1645_826564 [Glomus cerebriforme]|uniref:Uncharacterized protein n=1 Tax=Glomus cerebriforme TaxID=658196 RepID=A0A397SRF9_9GLOM|nr:hypothetical protein C1645_826564 [Glomus cerebriforme]
MPPRTRKNKEVKICNNDEDKTHNNNEVKTYNNNVQEKEASDTTTTIKQKRKYTQRKVSETQQVKDSTTKEPAKLSKKQKYTQQKVLAIQPLENSTINEELAEKQEYIQQRKNKKSPKLQQLKDNSTLKTNKIIDLINETDDDLSGIYIIYECYNVFA